MVSEPLINWIIIGIESLIGLIWSLILLSEFFAFLSLTNVKHKFDGESKFHIRKKPKSFFSQFLGFIVHLIFVAGIITAGIMLIDEYWDPRLLVMIVLLSLLILIIPKFVYSLLFSPYWIRQLKYFVLLGGLIMPLTLLDENAMISIPEIGQFWGDYATFLNVLLPAQLVMENGIVLTLEERFQIFSGVFIALPLALLIFVKLIRIILRLNHTFGIYEWLEDGWKKIDERAYEGINDSAVLLIHGLGSSIKIWSNYSKVHSSERIMDYLDMKADQRYMGAKIFAINFSDRLKNKFNTKYRPKNQYLEKFGNVHLNNYVWELLYTILLLKEIKKIEKIHLIAHSSGGLIVRKLLQEIYSSANLLSVKERLGYDVITSTLTLIDKISWLTVPHFGTKSNKRVILSIQHTIMRPLVKLLFSIPFLELVMTWLWFMSIFFGIDTQAVRDTIPGTKFLNSLNDNNAVTIYGKHDYKNVVARNDQLIGDGALIGKRYRKGSNNFEEKIFDVNHSLFWTGGYKKPQAKSSYDNTAVHHSLEVIHWIIGE